MDDSFTVQVAQTPVVGTIRPPGSKSITNRALICAALADGTSTLSGALDSEDTQVMIEGLRRLGVAIDRHDGGQRLVVAGYGGVFPATTADIYVANSGTTIRFLTAACAIGSGQFRFDGVMRMRQRPIGDLLAALVRQGAQVVFESENDFPPYTITANGLSGGEVHVAGDVSSQFLSGLLMAAPYALSPVTVVVEQTLVSVPYVKMTLRVMEAFEAVTFHSDDLSRIEVANDRRYRAQQYAIEPDASAASYWWAAAAVTGGEVTVTGLARDSLQGDVAFCECLQQMGCDVTYGDNAITVRGRELVGIDVDMNVISDTVQTLAVVALFAKGATNVRGVAHIRHKETDRLGALATELRKLGADVDERPDGITIHPTALRAAAIETYRDHRMAMSFAIAGLRIPAVTILDPACVDKTYPQFFADLHRLTENS